MYQTDRPDPEVAPLPPPIRAPKPEANKRLDEQIAPGVFRGIDGKFYTADPKNEAGA